MDLRRALGELYAQRERLLTAIAKLEALADSNREGGPARRSNRGRKSMGAAERREVSERMRKYWATRRRAEGAS